MPLELGNQGAVMNRGDCTINMLPPQKVFCKHTHCNICEWFNGGIEIVDWSSMQLPAIDGAMKGGMC